MTIEKFQTQVGDIDSRSITLNTNMQHQICCSECGETSFTLRRVKDSEGKKVKPARYVCVECYKNEKSIRKV